MWIEILYEFYILDQLRLICWLAFLLVHVLLRSRWPLLHQKLSQWNKMCWRWRKGPLFHHQYCHLSKKCNWFDFSSFCLSWKQKEYWKFLTSFSTSFHNLKLFGNYIEYCLFVFGNTLFQRIVAIHMSSEVTLLHVFLPSYLHNYFNLHVCLSLRRRCRWRRRRRQRHVPLSSF